jgi:hypothetical protein
MTPTRGLRLRSAGWTGLWDWTLLADEAVPPPRGSVLQLLGPPSSCTFYARYNARLPCPSPTPVLTIPPPRPVSSLLPALATDVPSLGCRRRIRVRCRGGLRGVVRLRRGRGVIARCAAVVGLQGGQVNCGRVAAEMRGGRGCGGGGGRVYR